MRVGPVRSGEAPSLEVFVVVGVLVGVVGNANGVSLTGEIVS